MKKILCTFLITMLTLTVSAQDDNIQRPPKKTVQQAPPKKTDQQVPPKRTQPAKPTKTTQQNTPSKSNTPSKPVNTPQQNVPSKPSAPSMPVSSKPSTGYENGYEWVDLGLSVKWATKNVGASSPSDYGGYYAWGETSTKSRYDWDNCFDCLDSSGVSWGIYKVGGQTKIAPTSGHDTARENWGGTWRMPTNAENGELCKKCTWTWTTQGDHKGYKVTGPNGNSIFLPAAGFRYGTGTISVGENGVYWSSTLVSSHSGSARNLSFDSRHYITSYFDRRSGRSIRPVTD